MPPSPTSNPAACAVVAIAAALAAGPLRAQSNPVPPAGGPSGGVNATGADPWYVGASQGIYRSSNVYRTPDGPSDVYSSTTLFGGVDTPIGRQRLYANGSVSLNRYRDEKSLNNTSYSLGAGADFETVMRLSGGINLGIDQQLAAPGASTAETPQQRRNLARTERIAGRVLWGGASTFTAEARAGYSRVDYADQAYAGSESSRREVGLTGYYRPGARLRVGLGVRADRTDQPAALVDPATGASQSNDVDSRSVDVLADYALTGLTSLSARLGYTRQSNSNALLANDDFSGLTGALNVSYRATGKLSANLSLSRDVGSASTGRTVYAVSLPTTPANPSNPPATPTLTTATVLYENNRVTNSATLGANYSATARIGVNAAVQYQRATVNSTSTAQAGAEVADSAIIVSLGAGYAITRLASLGCSAGYERRKVSGGVEFSYSVNTIGCSGSIRWP